MSILRDDAQKVAEALAALTAHDAHALALTRLGPSALSADGWAGLTIERRRLSSVLEERAGILARLVMAANP